MTGRSSEGGPRPAVYARLRMQAQRQTEPLRPGRWVRWAGWGLIAGIAIVILNIALTAHPWG